MSLDQQTGFFQKKFLIQAGIALAGAVISVACFRTGFFIFFFLLPLALVAFFGKIQTASAGSETGGAENSEAVTGDADSGKAEGTVFSPDDLVSAKIVWAAGILAIALNVIVAVWFFLYLKAEPFLLQLNALYYTVLVLVFTWINAPLGEYWINIGIPFRMILGAAFCSAIFVPLYLYVMHNIELLNYFSVQLQSFGALASTAGEGSITAEELVSGVLYVLIRGGVSLTCLIFWWLNRQFGFLVYRLFRRTYVIKTDAILGFRAPFFLVWVLSLSLGAILLGRAGTIELLDIAGWNVLVLSATLFLVQGGAILMYFLMRVPPLLRIVINVGIIILLFRPGVNAALLVVLVLLGIAENWVPFRAPKK